MTESSGAIKNIHWTDEQSTAAVMLAEGYTKSEVAREVGVNASTITRWTQNEEFAEEVDRLSLMYGLASKAERMRQIKRAARKFEDNDSTIAGYNYLDLLKEARIQTEGVKLDILSILTATTAVNEEARPVAISRPGISPGLPDPKDSSTD